MALMYALVEFTYDYYEWERTIAVSEDPARLRERYAEEDTDYPLISRALHRKFCDKEDHHFCIEPVAYIKARNET